MSDAPKSPMGMSSPILVVIAVISFILLVFTGYNTYYYQQLDSTQDASVISPQTALGLYIANLILSLVLAFIVVYAIYNALKRSSSDTARNAIKAIEDKGKEILKKVPIPSFKSNDSDIKQINDEVDEQGKVEKAVQAAKLAQHKYLSRKLGELQRVQEDITKFRNGLGQDANSIFKDQIAINNQLKVDTPKTIIEDKTEKETELKMMQQQLLKITEEHNEAKRILAIEEEKQKREAIKLQQQLENLTQTQNCKTQSQQSGGGKGSQSQAVVVAEKPGKVETVDINNNTLAKANAVLALPGAPKEATDAAREMIAIGPGAGNKIERSKYKKIKDTLEAAGKIKDALEAARK